MTYNGWFKDSGDVWSGGGKKKRTGLLFWDKCALSCCRGTVVARGQAGARAWESMGGRLGCNRSLPKAQRSSGGAPWKGGRLPTQGSLEAEVAVHRTGTIELRPALAERSDSVLSASPPVRDHHFSFESLPFFFLHFLTTLTLFDFLLPLWMAWRF